MKKYNHVNTIRLGKPNSMYCSIIDGTVVYINSISWFRDKCTGHKCCIVRRSSDDKRLYTSEEFHEEFKEMVSRTEELIKETTRAFAERIAKAMESVAANKQIKNHNGRIYTGTEFANYVADQIGNVGAALGDLGNTFDRKKHDVYSDKEYAIAISKNNKTQYKFKNLFTYDIVSDPGFPVSVSKPTKLKKGPYYG